MLTRRFVRRVQFVADVASIITCVVVTAFTLIVAVDLVRNPPSGRAAERAGRPSVSVGETLPPLGVNWAESDQTLLLALSRDCPYCRASAPFYQSLAKALSGHGSVRMVAVLPQPADQSRQYFEG